MEDNVFQRLGELQKKELDEILSLIDKFNTAQSNEEKSHLVRLLAVRHVVTKGILVPTMAELIDPRDIEYVKEVDKKLRAVLIPAYKQLHAMAVEHLEAWFLDTQRRKGSANPKLYGYQKRVASWILWATISNEMTEVLYTLLISRGGGKSVVFSVVTAFISIFHKQYVIHNKEGDFVTITTSGFENQLAGFRKYIKELLDLSTTNESGVGLIGKTQNEESELGLYFKHNSQEKVEICQNSGGSYCTIYFVLGTAEAIEGEMLPLMEVIS